MDGANLSHQLFVENGHPISTSSRNTLRMRYKMVMFSTRLSPLRNLFLHVLLLRSFAKMCRINTRRSVARMETLRNGHSPMREEKGSPVRADVSPLSLELAIAESSSQSLVPEPARTKMRGRLGDRTVLVYVTPKTGDVFFRSVLNCHKLKIARRASARAISSADAENGKSVCVSSQTNANKLPKTRESAT